MKRTETGQYSLTVVSTYETKDDSTGEITSRFTALNVDPTEDSNNVDSEDVSATEEHQLAEYQPTYATVAGRDSLNKEEESKYTGLKRKPAPVYIVNIDEWECLRQDMEANNISYTSAKQKRGEIEIIVADVNEHLALIVYLLQKGTVHKTYLSSKKMEELPEYMEEMRLKKNKACRDRQKYPTKEMKRIANTLTRTFRQEIANLRFNEYENFKSLFYEFSSLFQNDAVQ